MVLVYVCVIAGKIILKSFKGDGNPDDYHVLYERS